MLGGDEPKRTPCPLECSHPSHKGYGAGVKTLPGKQLVSRAAEGLHLFECFQSGRIS